MLNGQIAWPEWTNLRDYRYMYMYVLKEMANTTNFFIFWLCWYFRRWSVWRSLADPKYWLVTFELTAITSGMVLSWLPSPMAISQTSWQWSRTQFWNLTNTYNRGLKAVLVTGIGLHALGKIRQTEPFYLSSAVIIFWPQSITNKLHVCHPPTFQQLSSQLLPIWIFNFRPTGKI